MEASIPGAIQGASAILPVAMYVARGCYNHRVRLASKIQKHVLCLPSKGGKSLLFHKLGTQKKYLVIDVDEFLPTVCAPDELRRLDMAQSAGNFLQETIYYSECADKVLAYMRKQLKQNKSLKVLFVTSCWAWAQRFRQDAVSIACPDRDFFAQILERFPETKDELRVKREEFLESVPKACVQTYNSYEELESMVRKRLDIVHTL